MNATRFLSIPDSELERITRQVTKFRDAPNSDGCIEWLGAVDRYGYGKVQIYGIKNAGAINTSAHRVFWVMERGRINDASLVIDHLCRNRACVNTDHMELVSNHTNISRGAGPVVNRAALGLPEHRINTRRATSGKARGKARCTHGHPWIEENVYVYTSKAGYVSRSCKICSRERLLAWRAKQ